MYRRIITFVAVSVGLFFLSESPVFAGQCFSSGATQCVGTQKQYCPASGANWVNSGTCVVATPTPPKSCGGHPSGSQWKENGCTYACNNGGTIPVSCDPVATAKPPTAPPAATAPPVGPVSTPPPPRSCNGHASGSQWASGGCIYFCNNGLTSQVTCDAGATPAPPRPTTPQAPTAPPVGPGNASCGLHPHNSFWRQGACWNTCVNGNARETLDCNKPTAAPGPTSVPVGTTPKACTAIVNTFECGYTPGCIWQSSKCVAKGETGTYVLGTCTSPCPLTGSCTCPANCAVGSVSLGSGATCGGQKVTLDCASIKGIAVCQANPACTWNSFSNVTANGFCSNKPTAINSCISVCNSAAGVCACPVGCSKTFASNGVNCGGTKPTVTCGAGQWQCGNQCADGATQSSFNSVWCNGEARWKYESQNNQGGQVFCSGNSSVKKDDSANCTTAAGQIASCGQYTTILGCEGPGHACQYDYANNKCIPLTCIADRNVKPTGSTKSCCSGNVTYQANGLTYCGIKPAYVPPPVTPAEADPNTTCEKNNGNQVGCILDGCHYYPDTKSCVVYGLTNICQGGADSCDFGGTVGSSCTDADGQKGSCGRSVYTADSNSCLCKSPNFPITVNVGQTCPTNVARCVCGQQFIAAGDYCHPSIQSDAYCRDSRSCYCPTSGLVIAFGAQCRPFEPGIQQWIDRTNALRQACSRGELSPLECLGLGMYQSADALSLGGVSATNTSIENYKTCIREFGEGKRKSCVLEAALVIINASGVSQSLVGWAQFLISIPKNIAQTFQFGATGVVNETGELIIPAAVADDIANAGGKITPEIFKRDIATLYNLCPAGISCESEYELFIYLQKQGLTTDVPGAYGIATGGGSGSFTGLTLPEVIAGGKEQMTYVVEGQQAAFVQFKVKPETSTINITLIQTEAEYQRQGIAKYLTEVVEEYAQDLGITRLVSGAQPGYGSILLSLGWEEVGPNIYQKILN